MKKGKQFCQENALAIAKPSSNNTRDDCTHGCHQMVSSKIRLIIFFAVKRWRSSIQSAKTDQELTVSQIMNSLLPKWLSEEVFQIAEKSREVKGKG